MAARGVGHDGELEAAATPDDPSPDHGAPDHDSAGPHDRRLLGVLALAAVVGLALRIVVLVQSRWDIPVGQDDAGYYARQGRLIRHGHGFIDPFAYLYSDGRLVRPSAQHPPLFSLLMAGADAIGLGSINGMRLVGCVVGSVGIVVVGLLGREIAGRRVGMIAAGVAALYPIWWLSDSLLQAEALYMPLVAGTLLLGYRLWKRPTLGRSAALGFVGALAALTRSEGVLLLVLVAACVLFLRHGLPGIRRFQLLAVTLLVAGATVAPWLVYNATRFDRPVLMSTNDGATLADTNCPAAYSGPGLGLYVFQCHVPAVDESGDESDRARRLTEVGLRYARDHAGRLPVVVAARVGRVWGVFRPIDTIRADIVHTWSDGAAQLLAWSYALVAIGGLVGFFVLRRRRVPISPLVAAIVAVTITAATTYGIIRFRVPGDVAFVVLFAVTLDALVRRDFPTTSRAAPAEEWVSA